MTIRGLRWVFALTTLLGGVAVAADETPMYSGDPEAGQAKAGTCVACHGMDGNSISGEWPSLAGQHVRYLTRQLNLYKTGARQNAVMLGMVIALSEQDMRDISAFYASQTIKPGVADESLATLGRGLYRGGHAERDIPACMGCHGPSGAGNPGPAYPAVAGQKANYSAMVLKAFRDGAVWGQGDDANVVMSEIAADLTDREIEALASYMEGLHAAGLASGASVAE